MLILVSLISALIRGPPLSPPFSSQQGTSFIFFFPCIAGNLPLFSFRWKCRPFFPLVEKIFFLFFFRECLKVALFFFFSLAEYETGYTLFPFLPWAWCADYKSVLLPITTRRSSLRRGLWFSPSLVGERLGALFSEELVLFVTYSAPFFLLSYIRTSTAILPSFRGVVH